ISSYSLINGERALTLSITKTPDANTVEVSQLVKDSLPHLKDLVPEADFSVLIDQAPFIEDSISSLGIEGLLGLVMAVLVILLFLRSGRATLVTAVSIPTSLLIAFVSMQAAGYTLNMLSLGGLTIAIGRIVDDSIVVIENVERHMRYGKSRRDTIVDAVREVGAAITASTITTVAVFLPIALVGGMSGVLFRPFAFTVTVAMLASLLVALTIVPVLAYWFLKWRGPSPQGEQADVDEFSETTATQGWIQRAYGRLLDWVIGHRWSTLGIAVVVLIGTVALAPLIKTNFLGDMGQNELGVTQEVEPGTSLEEQLTSAQEVNDAILSVDGIETVATTIGSGDDLMSMSSSEDTISYSVTTDPDGDQERIEADVREAVTDVVDKEQVTISPIAGMGMSNDIEISVTGADPDDVEKATEQITDAMRDLPEARQVANSITTARPTVSVTVDREEAAELGLSESGVSQMIAGLLTPQQIGEITVSGSGVGVYLSPEDPVESVDEISQAELLGGMATV
ncbi:MAG TPA: efflux RND transporter permease subunit, partial [Beutenbergiaceae bacterium]|nr:efflux RND transporter permease subunit [Beutenbergiaceae bacterium]